MCKAYACMHIMFELARLACLHVNELVYASHLGFPADATSVCRMQAEHFRSRCEGLFSEELSVAM